MTAVIPGKKSIHPEKALCCWHEHKNIREYRECSRRLVDIEGAIADSLCENFDAKTKSLREENKILMKECVELRKKVARIKSALFFVND